MHVPIGEFKKRIFKMEVEKIKKFNSVQLTDCRAMKIWKIIRHGTRSPGKKVLKLMKDLPDVRNEIVANCEANDCYLSKATILRLKNWKFTLTDKDAMRLAEEGEDELIGLAERYQSRFPKLMPEKFNNGTFKVFFSPWEQSIYKFNSHMFLIPH